MRDPAEALFAALAPDAGALPAARFGLLVGLLIGERWPRPGMETMRAIEDWYTDQAADEQFQPATAAGYGLGAMVGQLASQVAARIVVDAWGDE